MPHIPIPPKPSTTSQQMIQKIQTIWGNTSNPTVQSILDEREVERIAEQQARMVLDEWMKQNKDLFD